MIYKLVVVIFVLFGSIGQIEGQVISSSVDAVYGLDEQASGYSISIDYSIQLNENNGILIGISHCLTSSDWNHPYSSYKEGIRSYKDISPYLSNIFYQQSDFPGINFPIRDNKYFRFDIYFLYENIFEVERFSINPGIIASYRDEKEVVDFIKAERIDLVFPPIEVNRRLIPIYNFSTYLDLGAMVQIDYILFDMKRLDIGMNSRFMYYPLSNDFSVQMGVLFQLDINKK